MACDGRGFPPAALPACERAREGSSSTTLTCILQVSNLMMPPSKSHHTSLTKFTGPFAVGKSSSC